MKLVSKEKEIKSKEHTGGPNDTRCCLGPLHLFVWGGSELGTVGINGGVGHRGGCIKPIGVGSVFPFDTLLSKEQNQKESKKHLVKVIINQ